MHGVRGWRGLATSIRTQNHAFAINLIFRKKHIFTLIITLERAIRGDIYKYCKRSKEEKNIKKEQKKKKKKKENIYTVLMEIIKEARRYLFHHLDFIDVSNAPKVFQNKTTAITACRQHY